MACERLDINTANIKDLHLISGVDENGCVAYQFPSQAPTTTETAWTGTGMSGVVVTPGGINGHAPIISLDLCAIQTPAGTIDAAVGRDASGCLVSEDDEAFVRRNETPWVGNSPLGTVDITSNGHAPNLDVALAADQGGVPNAIQIVAGDGIYAPDTAAESLCDLGGRIPVGVLNTVVGRDVAGCVIAEDDDAFVLRNETPFAAIAGPGIAITPGGVNGHMPTLAVDFCTITPTPVVDGGLTVIFGRNAVDCIAQQDPTNFVQFYENTWDGTSPLGSIAITNDGVGSPDSGHLPNLDVRLAPAQDGDPNALQIIAGQGLYMADCCCPDTTLVMAGGDFADPDIPTTPEVETFIDAQATQPKAGTIITYRTPGTGHYFAWRVDCNGDPTALTEPREFRTVSAEVDNAFVITELTAPTTEFIVAMVAWDTSVQHRDAQFVSVYNARVLSANNNNSGRLELSTRIYVDGVLEATGGTTDVLQQYRAGQEMQIANSGVINDIGPGGHFVELRVVVEDNDLFANDSVDLNQATLSLTWTEPVSIL